MLSALTNYIGDRVIEQSGGADRQSIDAPSKDGSGAAMFLGALLDGIPEAFILGITLSLGGGVSVAFVVAALTVAHRAASETAAVLPHPKPVMPQARWLSTV